MRRKKYKVAARINAAPEANTVKCVCGGIIPHPEWLFGFCESCKKTIRICDTCKYNEEKGGCLHGELCINGHYYNQQ